MGRGKATSVVDAAGVENSGRGKEDDLLTSGDGTKWLRLLLLFYRRHRHSGAIHRAIAHLALHPVPPGCGLMGEGVLEFLLPRHSYPLVGKPCLP